jgi:signal transduction histidine kinase
MSIRERTAALSGKIEIVSTPGEGTTVVLRAPLEANAS